jgi:phage terminase large subunit-like protein
VHHVGVHDALEDEQTTWIPDAGMRSPNRIDALVWALTELMVAPSGRRTLSFRGAA